MKMSLKNILKKVFGLVLVVALTVPIMPANAITERDVLVKGSEPAVYYYANDGKRYVFPTQFTYNSWFSDFNEIITISDTELGSIRIGGNVTYRPGIRLVKITTDPKVYAVSRNGVLRWINSETIAKNLYGNNWNKMIDDVPDAFFVNYSIGAPITSVSDYSPMDEANNNTTINDDKFISKSTNPRRANTTAPNISENVAPISPTPHESTLTINYFFLDTDGDHLPDVHEELWDTDPNNPDTDGDGFTDGDEIKSQYDPRGTEKLSPENTPKIGKRILEIESIFEQGDYLLSFEDEDGDYFELYEEVYYGLDPNNPDTDGDGERDSNEFDRIYGQPIEPRVVSRGDEKVTLMSYSEAKKLNSAFRCIYRTPSFFGDTSEHVGFIYGDNFVSKDEIGLHSARIDNQAFGWLYQNGEVILTNLDTVEQEITDTGVGTYGLWLDGLYEEPTDNGLCESVSETIITIPPLPIYTIADNLEKVSDAEKCQRQNVGDKYLFYYNNDTNICEKLLDNNIISTRLRDTHFDLWSDENRTKMKQCKLDANGYVDAEREKDAVIGSRLHTSNYNFTTNRCYANIEIGLVNDDPIIYDLQHTIIVDITNEKIIATKIRTIYTADRRRPQYTGFEEQIEAREKYIETNTLSADDIRDLLRKVDFTEEDIELTQDERLLSIYGNIFGFSIDRYEW